LGSGITNAANYKGIDDFGWTGNNLYLYFNSVNISGTATGTTNTFAYSKRDAVNETHNNNIYVNTRTGGTGKHYAIGVTIITGTFTSDYNDFFTANAPIGIWGAVDQADLTAWRTTTAQDANSKDVDPQFVSSTDLHTLRFELNNAGIAIPAVPADHDGVTRKNPPDIGAYEFSLITTYTWIGADNGAWTTPTNWTPTRTVPETTDILQFNDGTTKNVTGVPTQTIGKLIMSNNTIINLQSSAAVTLSISGGDGADLD
jgi:hypothetical protein